VLAMIEADIGRPWSAKELNDLVRGLQIGVSVAVIADFMARHAEEGRLVGITSEEEVPRRNG
jgi:hypothetical protein